MKPSISLVLILIVAIMGCTETPLPTETTQPESQVMQENVEDVPVSVTRIIDGDTFELSNGETVRLIGIDTPERGDYYYEEADKRLEELVMGKEIVLTKDVSESDRYGRLLRFVYIGDTLVNEVLVEEGYARAYSYKPDVTFRQRFASAEMQAKQNQLGIWFNFSVEPLEQEANIEGDPACESLGCTTPAVFVGSINSNKYHKCHCRWAGQIHRDNLKCFSSVEDAESAGYMASQSC